MKKGDIAIQINNPEDSQFVKILSIRGDMVEHVHLGSRLQNGGVARKRVIRKCTKQELMIAKIKHGL
jgi:hypothetical protein